MTVICLILTIITAAFFGDIYISGSEMSQINNEFKYWKSQNISLDNDFKFAIANHFHGVLDMRQDMYSIEAFYVDFDAKTYTFHETKLEIITCNKLNWQTNVREQFDFLELEKAMCFDVNGLVIKGNLNSDVYSYIRIKYTLALKENDNLWNSQLEENIARLSPVATVFFMEGMFNIKGKETTTEYFINTIPINITYNNIKDLDISISKDEMIVNQDKIFVTLPKTTETYVVYDAREKISVRGKGKTNILSINLTSSKIKKSVNISFMTFSSLLANIGAIVQNLIAIFFIVNHLKNYWSYELNQFNMHFSRLEKDYFNECSIAPIKQKINYYVNECGFFELKNKLKNSESPDNDNLISTSKNINEPTGKNLVSAVNNNNSLYYNPSFKEDKVNQHQKTLAILKRNNINNISIASGQKKINNGDCYDSKYYNINQISERSNSIQSNIKENLKILKELNQDINAENNNDKLVLDINKLSKKDSELKHYSFNTNNINNVVHNNDFNELNNNHISSNNKIKYYNNDKVVSKEKKQYSAERSKKILITLKAILKPVEKNLNDEQSNYKYELLKIKSKNEEKFELNLFEYLLNKYFSCILKKGSCFSSIFNSAKSKFNTYNYVNEYMNESLEMMNYEKNYFQINMLKYVLLNNQQIKAFETIPLVKGFEVIKLQNEASFAKLIDYNFCYELNSFENLTPIDEKIHGMYLGI